MGCVQVLAVDEIPLAYLPGGIVRLHVKVVGDLQTAPQRPTQYTPQNKSDQQQSQLAVQQEEGRSHQESQQQQPKSPVTPPQQKSHLVDSLVVPDSASPPSEAQYPNEPHRPGPDAPPYLATPKSHQPDPSETHHPEPHYPDPSETHHPDPYETHHPNPFEPHHLDGSSHWEAAAEAGLVPYSPPELSHSEGRDASRAEWMITKEHVEALAIGNITCTMLQLHCQPVSQKTPCKDFRRTWGLAYICEG